MFAARYFMDTHLNFTGHKDLPSVAVVILNWNGKSFLQTFLPAVISTAKENVKIIVADNASSDDSISFLKNKFPTVEIILNPGNEGFAKGYNTALQKVDADYFVLLNSDVEVTLGWIEPIITLMKNDRMIGACQPKILDQKNKDYFEYAGACGGWLDALGYPFARGRVLEKLEKDEGQYNDAAPCFWASGAAMFLQASVFRELGGFEESFFAHQEEIDLCWRMQLAGYKVFVEPASVVYHVGGGTLPKGNSKKIYLNFRNNLLMIYRNTAAVRLLWLLPLRIFLDVIAAFKQLLSGDTGYFFAVAKAHLHFMARVLSGKSRSRFVNKGSGKLYGRYPGSLLAAYYFRNKRTFSEIVKGK